MLAAWAISCRSDLRAPLATSQFACHSSSHKHSGKLRRLDSQTPSRGSGHKSIRLLCEPALRASCPANSVRWTEEGTMAPILPNARLRSAIASSKPHVTSRRTTDSNARGRGVAYWLPAERSAGPAFSSSSASARDVSAAAQVITSFHSNVAAPDMSCDHVHVARGSDGPCKDGQVEFARVAVCRTAECAHAASIQYGDGVELMSVSCASC